MNPLLIVVSLSIFMFPFSPSSRAFFQEIESPQENPATVTIRVLSLNVWDLGEVDGKYTDERFTAICEQFKEAFHNREEGWDIILLQELWPVKERKEAFTQCGYPYIESVDREYHKIKGHKSEVTHSYFGDKADTGLRILSRFPLKNPRRHTYTQNGLEDKAFDDGEWIARKSVMAVELEHPKAGNLLVANTHMIYTHNGKDKEYVKQQKVQLRELIGFLNENFSTNVTAVILGGDFSFDPSEEHAEILPSLFQTLPQYTSIDDCSYCPSQNAFAALGGYDADNADNIFVSRNIRIKNSAIVMDKAEVPIKTPEGLQLFHYSDHFGVETELEIDLKNL